MSKFPVNNTTFKSHQHFVVLCKSMHEIEPYYRWSKFYNSTEDPNSPFFEKVHSEFEFTESVYNHVIHPQWDYFGSETLYLKLLFVDYENGYAIIEFIGEWNDAISNDVMHLKRNILDYLADYGINKYVLLGENIFNFHYSDDSYYEEWFDDVEDGWIIALEFQEHVLEEWKRIGVDYYINFGGLDQFNNWRTKTPYQLCEEVDQFIGMRLE